MKKDYKAGDYLCWSTQRSIHGKIPRWVLYEFTEYDVDGELIGKVIYDSSERFAYGLTRKFASSQYRRNSINYFWLQKGDEGDLGTTKEVTVVEIYREPDGRVTVAYAVRWQLAMHRNTLGWFNLYFKPY